MPHTASPSANNTPVAIWLFICAFMVLCTLVIGGATRLTHSGLSIVEWKPIAGAVPPLSEGAWAEEFAKYRQTPEFGKVNHQMTQDEFKGIFWWEFLHRLSGRAIGVAFAVPWLFFLLRRRIGGALGLKLFGIFLLGAAQGAMGWYMVKSGLVDDPRVSHFRLTAHLTLAFIIFTCMLWVALGLLRQRTPVRSVRPSVRALQRFAAVLAGLVLYMVVTGGFVAGIRAGKAYNSFPLMNGHVVPPEIFMIEPWYLNFVNNMATVQFDHRLGAWLLAALVPLFCWRLRTTLIDARCRRAANWLLLAIAAQIALGIATVLNAVPVLLGTLHQGGAMLLFGVTLWLNHELRSIGAVTAPGRQG